MSCLHLFFGQIPVQGWVSLLIVFAFFSGSVSASLDVTAEYWAVTFRTVVVTLRKVWDDSLRARYFRTEIRTRSRAPLLAPTAQEPLKSWHIH